MRKVDLTRLLQAARREFDRIGFISALTSARLASQGIDVGGLETRFASSPA